MAKKGRIRLAALLLAGAWLAGMLLPLSARAAQSTAPASAAQAKTVKGPIAEIPGGTAKRMKTAVFLDAGAGITIQGFFTPEKTKLEFGLISPDGVFHYLTVSGGNIHVTIVADQPGEYMLAIRNRSSRTVRVPLLLTY